MGNRGLPHCGHTSIVQPHFKTLCQGLGNLCIREAIVAPRHIRPVFAILGDMGKWCTVTLLDKDGRRHSLDVNAESSYDAAHLYVTHAKSQAECGLPIPTLASVFEIVFDGKVFRVKGEDLERWIVRAKWAAWVSV